MTKQDYGITKRLELFHVWLHDYKAEAGCTDADASTKAFNAVTGLSGEQCQEILDALGRASGST